MTEQDKKEMAQSFIRGLANRDAKLLHSIMTEDVVWSLPGESPMSGEAKGVESILNARAPFTALTSRSESNAWFTACGT